MANSHLRQAAADVWRAVEDAGREARELQVLIDETRRAREQQTRSLRRQRSLLLSTAAQQSTVTEERFALERQAQDLENRAIQTEQDMNRKVNQLIQAVHHKELMRNNLESQARNLERQAAQWG